MKINVNILFRIFFKLLISRVLNIAIFVGDGQMSENFNSTKIKNWISSQMQDEVKF